MKAPFLSDTALPSFWPLRPDSSTAVTVTPARGTPKESVTTPVRVAPEAAAAVAGPERGTDTNTQARIAALKISFFMLAPFFTSHTILRPDYSRGCM